MLPQSNVAHSSESSSVKGEVMRTAMILIKCKGSGALEYSNHKAEVMQSKGIDEDVAFWQKISKQIEILLYSKE